MEGMSAEGTERDEGDEQDSVEGKRKKGGSWRTEGWGAHAVGWWDEQLSGEGGCTRGRVRGWMEVGEGQTYRTSVMRQHRVS